MYTLVYELVLLFIKTQIRVADLNEIGIIFCKRDWTKLRRSELKFKT